MKTLLIFCLIGFVFSFTCEHNYQCEKLEYCSKTKKCEKKPKEICVFDDDCKDDETCLKFNVNFGKCQKSKTKRKKRIEIPFKRVPTLSKEEYEAIPKESSAIEKEYCGNEFMKFKQTKQENEKNVPPCGLYSCDDPVIRNNYTTSTSFTMKLYWMYFNCTPWKDEAMQRIAEATYDLNVHFLRVGIQFNSYIQFYPCKGSTGNQDYNTFTYSEAANAVILEIGPGYLQNGNLYIVTGTPDDGRIAGWMMLLNSAYFGTGFMNTVVVKKGQTTLPHEIGHAFGLKHTFSGISEIGGCVSCRENEVTDLKGDFCADTPPIIRNWECTSPLSASGQYRDICVPSRQWWDPNPYQNLLSYGTCRKDFTECQVRRIRCFHKRYLYSFTNDTNPVQNPPLVSPVSPIEPKPSNVIIPSYIPQFIIDFFGILSLVFILFIFSNSYNDSFKHVVHNTVSEVSTSTISSSNSLDVDIREPNDIGS
eukprot:gene11857-5186_t